MGLLKVAAIEVEPYIMRRDFTKSSSRNISRYIGYIPDLLDELFQPIGISYDLYVVSDGSYGNRDAKTGEWDGMIGEVQKGIATMAAGPLFPTELRREVVDFTVPFLPVSATLILRRTPPSVTPKISSISDLIDQSEVAYGTLDRGLILNALRRTNDSTLRVVWRHLLNAAATSFTKTNEEGIERVQREKFAFILPDTIGDYVAGKAPCDLRTVGKFLVLSGYSLAVKRCSKVGRKFADGSGGGSSSAECQLMEFMDEGITSLRESGVLERLRRRWWEERSECLGEGGGDRGLGGDGGRQLRLRSAADCGRVPRRTGCVSVTASVAIIHCVGFYLHWT